MYDSAVNILDQEGITYDKKTIAKLIQNNFPDFRKSIMALQHLSACGHIDDTMLVGSGVTNIEELITILKEKKFKEMRTWVAENVSYSESEVVALLDKLYDNMDNAVMPQSMPQLILILADYSYKSAFVANQQINMAAMLTEIMSNVEWVV